MVLILGLVFALVLLMKSTLSFSVVDLATISIPYSCSLVNYSVIDTIHIIISSWLNMYYKFDLYF